MPAVIFANDPTERIELVYGNTKHYLTASKVLPRQAPTSTLAAPAATTTHPINTAVQKPSQEVVGGVIVGCVTIFVLGLILCCCCYRRNSWGSTPSYINPHRPARSHRRVVREETRLPQRPVPARIRTSSKSEDILGFIQPPSVNRPARHKREDDPRDRNGINWTQVPRGTKLTVSHLWTQAERRQ
ncbi:hypothetical protein P280DRAFT_97222 [Massarina eburnea CBS 473.64]|uniref:Uncharacterized protein n=1 Tax=Massarina eburnea CBS 473.64 TaxID=1395130 RepID=A0A6A6RQE9_9PLEO|nr:hypothetical protein P280DRAFT_97222 [Massarina eburnea CBS 473.64]